MNTQVLPDFIPPNEYVEFYRRNGFELPGDNPATPAFFMGHDMTHVIAGYGTSGEADDVVGQLMQYSSMTGEGKGKGNYKISLSESDDDE